MYIIYISYLIYIYYIIYRERIYIYTERERERERERVTTQYKLHVQCTIHLLLLVARISNYKGFCPGILTANI